MGEMRIYNFCPKKTQEILSCINKTFKKTGTVIIEQYEIKEDKECGGYFYDKERRYKRMKCCKNHRYLPQKSEITTVIKYK